MQRRISRCRLVAASAACAALGSGGCATTAAVAVGPTIDSNADVRLEVNAGGGPILDGNDVAGTDRPVGLAVFGFRAALGVGAARALTQGWGGIYVEYLRLGTSSSPWGYHATFTLAGGFDRGGCLVAAFSAGPSRASSIDMRDSNDGPLTTFGTNGVDLSIRGRLGESGTAAPWQLGVFYVRQSSTIYP